LYEKQKEKTHFLELNSRTEMKKLVKRAREGEKRDKDQRDMQNT